MSKDNMLLGYARGKVGSLVFARRKGLQITRAYNANPANPKTPAQINQRMKMYAPTNLYKRIRSRFFPFAFEDQRPNETAYNAFMRHNINVSPWVSRQLASEYAPVPFRAVMSEGSLPAIYGNLGYIHSAQDDTRYNSFHVELTGEPDTVARASIGLMEKFPSLQLGDKVTFVAFLSEGLSVEDGDVLYDGVGAMTVKTAQLVLSSSDNTQVSDLGFGLGWGSTPTQGAPSFLGIQFGAVQEKQSLGGCIIVTRQDGNKVLVSSSVMELNDYAANTILSTMSGVLYRDEFAAPSYRVSEPDYLNPTKEI